MQEDKDKPGNPRLRALREAVRRRAETDREAQRAVNELRLVKLQEQPAPLWLVMGRMADYVVVPGGFCSCPHFTIRVMSGETVEPCYHLVAVYIAERTGRYHDLSAALSPEEVEDVILETVYNGRSALVRRKLYRPAGRG